MPARLNSQKRPQKVVCFAQKIVKEPPFFAEMRAVPLTAQILNHLVRVEGKLHAIDTADRALKRVIKMVSCGAARVSDLPPAIAGCVLA